MPPVTGTTVVPRADEVIGRFFAEHRRGSNGGRLRRLERAEADLRTCLEVLAPRLLTESELALLALEREFESEGAAARVAGADAILTLLPVFLEEYRWQGDDLEDRKLRIRLAEPLAHEVLRLPELRGVRLGRAVGRVEATVRHAIWMVRQEREVARHG